MSNTFYIPTAVTVVVALWVVSNSILSKKKTLDMLFDQWTCSPIWLVAWLAWSLK